MSQHIWRQSLQQTVSSTCNQMIAYQGSREDLLLNTLLCIPIGQQSFVRLLSRCFYSHGHRTCSWHLLESTIGHLACIRLSFLLLAHSSLFGICFQHCTSEGCHSHTCSSIWLLPPGLSQMDLQWSWRCQNMSHLSRTSRHGISYLHRWMTHTDAYSLRHNLRLWLEKAWLQYVSTYHLLRWTASCHWWHICSSWS